MNCPAGTKTSKARFPSDATHAIKYATNATDAADAGDATATTQGRKRAAILSLRTLRTLRALRWMGTRLKSPTATSDVRSRQDNGACL